MTTDTVVPVQYSPYDYQIHEDPYPTYARLRDEAPLYRNDDLDFWALSRHDDVLSAFRNPAQLSNRFGVSLDPAAYGPDAHRSMSFLALDPPDHTRMRSLVSKAFTPRRVAELEDGVRRLAVEHVEAAVERATFDFVADFAGLLPMDVISEMIGVPRSDRAELRRLADLLMHRVEGFNDVPPEGVEAAFAMAGYFDEMVRARRAARPRTSPLRFSPPTWEGTGSSTTRSFRFSFSWSWPATRPPPNSWPTPGIGVGGSPTNGPRCSPSRDGYPTG